MQIKMIFSTTSDTKGAFDASIKTSLILTVFRKIFTKSLMQEVVKESVQKWRFKMSEIKRNYKEIAKTNMFIAHAAEIRDICLKEDVDIGVGLDMYISNHGIQTEEIMKQYQEFRKYCREDTLKSIVEALGK